MTYYLDAPSLGSATGVYIDPSLSTCAPDGFYSDGSIVRELVGCVLQPQKVCKSCGSICDNTYDNNQAKIAVYKVTIDLGNSPSNIGAVIISFDPLNYPKGIEAEYNGFVYNALSSPTYGFLQGNLGVPTYIGDQDLDCGLTTGFHTLPNYIYNPSSFVYLPDGTTQVVNIFPSQVQTTPNNPGTCVFVVPKTSINPSTLTLTVFSPCFSNFNITVKCPSALPKIFASQVGSLPETVCGLVDKTAYYNASVNGNGVILGLYDWIFLDSSGEFHAPDGYYYAPTAVPTLSNWFRVENGIVVEFGQCL